jgi:molybdopterin converting factor small subunit
LEPSLSINDVLTKEDAILSDGDILSIIPAVSGG